MDKKTIIFDFDGTIANTLEAVVKIYNKAAPKFHCKTVNQEDLTELKSKNTQQFFKQYGVTNFKLPFLVLHIRKELHHEIANIKPIEGIILALNEIKKSGFDLGIMTSNSKENIRVFLEVNKLTNIFDFIYSGKNIFGKANVIKKLLQEQKIKPNSALYVGDETRDIEAAKKINLPIIAVSWGYNNKDILAPLKPDFLIDKPEELLGCLQVFQNNTKNSALSQ